mmetsp:Transcript_65752/g.196490  ORF Transcript_65752/g.196490 Transcript_65752/m.196490 type:complete len:581 (-) Transcript_65752:194-1936(-)
MAASKTAATMLRATTAAPSTAAASTDAANAAATSKPTAASAASYPRGAPRAAGGAPEASGKSGTTSKVVRLPLPCGVAGNSGAAPSTEELCAVATTVFSAPSPGARAPAPSALDGAAAPMVCCAVQSAHTPSTLPKRPPGRTTADSPSLDPPSLDPPGVPWLGAATNCAGVGACSAAAAAAVAGRNSPVSQLLHPPSSSGATATAGADASSHARPRADPSEGTMAAPSALRAGAGVGGSREAARAPRRLSDASSATATAVAAPASCARARANVASTADATSSVARPLSSISDNGGSSAVATSSRPTGGPLQLGPQMEMLPRCDGSRQLALSSVTDDSSGSHEYVLAQLLRLQQALVQLLRWAAAAATASASSARPTALLAREHIAPALDTRFSSLTPSLGESDAVLDAPPPELESRLDEPEVRLPHLPAFFTLRILFGLGHLEGECGASPTPIDASCTASCRTLAIASCTARANDQSVSRALSATNLTSELRRAFPFGTPPAGFGTPSAAAPTRSAIPAISSRPRWLIARASAATLSCCCRTSEFREPAANALASRSPSASAPPPAAGCSPESAVFVSVT